MNITKRMLLVFLVLFLMSGYIMQFGAKAAGDRLCASYIYFGKPASYADLVDKTGNSLNQVSPSYFDLNSDGTLKLNQSIDTNFIAVMHAKGIKVVPFLSNGWSRQTGINALQIGEKLSQQIADAIVQYNLDGVDVDIENLTENERTAYVDFVRLLREKLPAGKCISVAVAANPYGSTKGWAGSYDYAGLAKYCDHLAIMAYDEHYQGSAEGPIASAKFVEDSILYGLKNVSPDKLVLGIPFYGRYWEQGSSYGGYGVSAYKIEELISKYSSVVTFDSTSRSPKAVITIKPEDEKPVLLGSPLEAGQYSIWYENDESIKYKLRLVQKYGLKGTIDWSLGQESSGTWSYYKLWLNGQYFSDIDDNWAQKQILEAEQNGWMLGSTSTTFMPDEALTRAQAAVVMVRMLGLSSSAVKPSFPDTKNHWAWKEIEAAKEAGIIVGAGNGRFYPESPVTREQMAVILDRVLVNLTTPENLTNSFLDVSESQSPWAYDSILKMAYYGIVTGYSTDKFYPSDNLTRAQMAALLERISGYVTSGTVTTTTGN